MRAINLSTLARHLKLATPSSHRAGPIVRESAEEIIMLLSSDADVASSIIDEPNLDEDGKPLGKKSGADSSK